MSAYIACARRLLAAPDAVFPQFATHNAHTLGRDLRDGGRWLRAGQYEFQCLHGMGEPLYEAVVGPEKLEPPVPHLRAGRHARDAAGLSRAPAAGERRQHLLRQPHRRSGDHRSTSWSPIRWRRAAAVEPLGAPHAKIALPRGAVRRRAGEFGGRRFLQRAATGLARRRRCCARRRQRAARWATGRREPRRRAGAQSGRRGATSSATWRKPARRDRRGRRRRRLARAPCGRRRRRPSAPPACCARPT